MVKQAMKVSNYLWRTPMQGARPTMYAALSTDPEVSAGGWFVNAMTQAVRPEHLDHADKTAAAQLWEVSARLTRDYVTQPLP